jgi:hypothetical protein
MPEIEATPDAPAIGSTVIEMAAMLADAEKGRRGQSFSTPCAPSRGADW